MNDSERPSSPKLTPTSGSSKGSGSTGSSYVSKSRRRAGAAKPSEAWSLLKTAFAVLVCVSAMSAGVIAGHLYWSSALMRKLGSGFLSHPTDPLADYTINAKFPIPQQHVINVLLLGCDRDYKGKMVNGIAVPVPIMTTNGRSDAILIARFDFDKNTIRVLSIPRDTAVRIPSRGISKINAAYSAGGAEQSKQTIKDAFGVSTDLYLALHFEAFQQLVDDVGGVDVTVHKTLDYDDNWANLHVHLKPGYQHLDGYKAMGYVRIRHSDSDLQRAERQHEFLEALRDKIKNPAILWTGANALNAVMSNISTDMSTDQLIALANWARSVPKENIELQTLPSYEDGSFVYVNEKKSIPIIREIFYNNDPLAQINIDVVDRTPKAKPGKLRRQHSVALDTVNEAVQSSDAVIDNTIPSAADKSADPGQSTPTDNPQIRDGNSAPISTTPSQPGKN